MYFYREVKIFRISLPFLQSKPPSTPTPHPQRTVYRTADLKDTGYYTFLYWPSYGFYFAIYVHIYPIYFWVTSFATIKMEAENSPETSVSVCQTTLRHNAEDQKLLITVLRGRRVV
jgi:hypothetical protein